MASTEYFAEATRSLVAALHLEDVHALLQDREALYSSDRPYSYREVLTIPFIEYWPTYVFFVVFFFAVQFATPPVTCFLAPRRWAKFKNVTEQNEYVARVVAIVHGFFCLMQAYCHYTQPVLPTIWHPIPNGWTFYHSVTTAYFVWDLTVCLQQQWGPLYTLHGFICLTCSYIMQLPYCLRWHSISGWWEVSPLLNHGAVVLRNLGGPEAVAYGMEVVFGFYFLIIRCIIGTWIGIDMTGVVYGMLMGTGGSRAPNRLPLPIVMYVSGLFWMLCTLQFVWMYEICMVALGKRKPTTPATMEEARSSPTTKKPKRD